MSQDDNFPCRFNLRLILLGTGITVHFLSVEDNLSGCRVLAPVRIPAMHIISDDYGYQFDIRQQNCTTISNCKKIGSVARSMMWNRVSSGCSNLRGVISICGRYVPENAPIALEFSPNPTQLLQDDQLPRRFGFHAGEVAERLKAAVC